jgi:putative transposase
MMQKSRLTEEQIIAILAEQERGRADSGRLSQARAEQGNFFQIQSKEGRHGRDQRPYAEDAGDRERPAEADADAMLDNTVLKDLLGKS